jgi:hypothetical protein
MRTWQPTGQTVMLPGRVDRIPVFDERTKEHFWVVAPTFHVDPRQLDDITQTPYLDHESIVVMTPVFCWHCEEPFSQRLRHRACKPSNAIKDGP